VTTRLSETQPDDSHGRSTEEHVVILRLADEYYALDIQAVEEIVRMQAITSIPGADIWVQGVTNLRGRVVPVIDVRHRCGVAAGEYTPETRIVVVSSTLGIVGLIVDAVTEVMRIPADQIEAPGVIVSAQNNNYIRGIAKLENRLVSLMDLEGVLPSESTFHETAEPAEEAEMAAAA